MDTGKERTESAEEILRARFARGEIDVEEYERSLEVLKSRGGTACGRGSKSKLLVAGLLAAALLAVVGAGVAFGQAGSGHSQQGEHDGSGGMGSMMGGGGMSGGHGGMSGGQTMGSFNEEEPFDLQFIDMMIPHHQGALMSSEHMIADSERPELRQLYENIQKSQSEQIEQMQAWREEWYPEADLISSGGMASMMGGGGMSGGHGEGQEEQGSHSMIGGPRSMMGGDTADAMFLRMMIPHHQDAVDMSEEALERAEHPELKELAQQIKDEQSAEIELMQGYLDEIEETTGASHSATDASHARQAKVAERGAQVMPFDLEKTTHVFEPTEDGGVQQVVADDPTDQEQLSLIREHLKEEADKFSQGDFSDPAEIHGEDMPGLKELEENASSFEVSYSELPDGAQIEYTTDEPALVSALHDWFEAQLSDHAEHATGSSEA
jgi:uncharacterized protein (DUF305 family)